MAQKVGQYINPVLHALRRLGGTARPTDVCQAIVEDLGLENMPVLEERVSTGGLRFPKTIAWVRQYLVLTGYIDPSTRGVWTLTEKGRTPRPLSEEEISQLLLDVQRRGKTLRDGTPRIPGFVKEPKVQAVRLDNTDSSPNSAFGLPSLVVPDNDVQLVGNAILDFDIPTETINLTEPLPVMYEIDFDEALNTLELIKEWLEQKQILGVRPNREGAARMLDEIKAWILES